MNPSEYSPTQTSKDEQDTFLRVWQRVMPEERPDCPITVERPEMPAAPKRPAPDGSGDDFPAPEDVPCLGSGGTGEQERLQSFVARELAACSAYRMLARRSGQGSGVLASLSAGCRRRAKRLSAALFLISNVRFWPERPAQTPPPRSYLGALREHFLSEQNRAADYRAGAEECQDGCLRALYLDLADECTEHACRIRTLLEAL